MSTRKSRLILVLLAFCAVFASPTRAANIITPVPGQYPFFGPATYLGADQDGNEVYYLSYFKTFTFTYSDGDYYFYKYDFGWLYFLSGTASTVSPTVDAYFYDFATDDVFYTSSDLYPYFYSFGLDSWLYYFEDSSPREFYDLRLDNYLFYPAGESTVSR